MAQRAVEEKVEPSQGEAGRDKVAWEGEDAPRGHQGWGEGSEREDGSVPWTSPGLDPPPCPPHHRSSGWGAESRLPASPW